MDALNFPYKLSIPTDAEAEKIHEKMDTFNANQLSFNGNVEVLKDSIFKYGDAKAMGVKLVHLDTFDFQAKDSYLKHGYKILGVLGDCPKGHKRYYLKKILPE